MDVIGVFVGVVVVIWNLLSWFFDKFFWLFIIIAIIYVFYVKDPNRRYKKILKFLMEEAEETDEYHKKNNLKMPNASRKYLENLEKLRDNYIRFKERFKHDSQKKRAIEKDWNDFLTYTEDLKNDIDVIGVAGGEQNDRYRNIDELHIKMQEIEKRFNGDAKKNEK